MGDISHLTAFEAQGFCTQSTTRQRLSRLDIYVSRVPISAIGVIYQNDYL